MDEVESIGNGQEGTFLEMLYDLILVYLHGFRQLSKPVNLNT